MVTTVNVHEAKTHLSRLLASVARGDEVIIAKNGLPLARLVSVNARPARIPGRYRGQIRGVEALLEPMSEAEFESTAEGTSTDPLRQNC